MKKIIDDVRLMVKVCDLYYNKNISQQQIAKMLNLSRPTVSRLLSSAKEQGIVRITISGLEEIKYWELERQLEETYNLNRVIIVESQPTEEKLKNALGIAACHYLETLIKDENTVGVSMGSTIYQVASQFYQSTAKNVTFVPLIGGMGQLRMELHANSLSERLSRAYQGKFIPFHAPARVSSSKIRDELMQEESLKEAIRLAEHMDIAVLGIGYPNENSSIKATGYFEENEIESLIKRRVAGEICMQFFDISGDTSPYQDDNNVVGIDIHRLQKIPYSIGIAGGIEKSMAVKGAVAGQYINVLITDTSCANAMAAEA
ncbi:MAG: sugar-binding transcriptional regulator [Lachnospiraceae bacterium]|nr:sugar-binding transcriptional regulator [Lachnospiraceae bacterium]